MRGDVKTAILNGFDACLPAAAIRPGRRDYTCSPQDNLLPNIAPVVLADFAQGDGSELGHITHHRPWPRTPLAPSALTQSA